MTKRTTHDMRAYSYAEPPLEEYAEYLQIIDSGEGAEKQLTKEEKQLWEKQLSEWHFRASWELTVATQEKRAPHPKAVEVIADALNKVQFENHSWEEAFRWSYRPTIELPKNIDEYDRKFEVAWFVRDLYRSGKATDDCFEIAGRQFSLSPGGVRKIYYQVKKAWEY